MQASLKEEKISSGGKYIFGEVMQAFKAYSNKYADIYTTYFTLLQHRNGLWIDSILTTNNNNSNKILRTTHTHTHTQPHTHTHTHTQPPRTSEFKEEFFLSHFLATMVTSRN
jgi:hypothetical protein